MLDGGVESARHLQNNLPLFFLSVLVVLGIVSPLLLPISGILGVALDDATLAHNSVPSSALVFANDT